MNVPKWLSIEGILVIGITITFPDISLYFYLLIAIIIFAIIALISRILALTKKVELEDMN